MLTASIKWPLNTISSGTTAKHPRNDQSNYEFASRPQPATIQSNSDAALTMRALMMARIRSHTIQPADRQTTQAAEEQQAIYPLGG